MIRFWMCLGTVWLVMAVSPAVAQEDPAALLTAGLRDTVTAPLRQLLNASLPADERRDAAANLLSQDHRDALRAIAAAVDVQAPDHVWRATASAIALYPGRVRDEWWPALLNRYTLAASEDDLALLADALGRFNDDKLQRRLRETAEDAAEPVDARVRMIRLWGYFRSKDTCERLLRLTGASQPPLVRSAAYQALINLTGMETLNQDPAAWQTWWDEARRLSDNDWLSHLLSNQARQQTAMRLRMSEGERRLLESQQAIYRTTQPADRPAVLAYMLRDPLPTLRQLGLDLALQRLLDDQPFEEALRVALRERLLDRQPEIRSRAALLLRDLLDEPASRIAADRLANHEEHVLEVIRAYLLLSARLPQQPVVEPALDLLDEPALRPEAAATLAAAMDSKMLDGKQIERAVQLARRGLPENGLPLPQVITLLGKIDADEDFQRIAKWVDADSQPVKLAAASAWAESARPLKMLADRAGDPTIQPIVISASERRGGPDTLRALSTHRPQQPEMLEAWRRALVAMAGRVSADHVLWTVDYLDAEHEDLATLERLLTAAVPAADATEPLTDAQIQLLLKRAEIRVRALSPTPALADFDRLASMVSRMSAGQVDRYRRNRIDALLDVGDFARAFDEARRLLGPEAGSGTLPPTDDPIIDQFVEAARLQADQRKPDSARDIMGQLRRLLGPSIKPEIAQRLRLLEFELRQPPGENTYQELAAPAPGSVPSPGPGSGQPAQP
ncbi:MAG: hypothetical protein IT445_11590 [Phycisphaeraceae bacterium]|nr:hypothetical protein [Phycisphaeraceae bacterium]